MILYNNLEKLLTVQLNLLSVFHQSYLPFSFIIFILLNRNFLAYINYSIGIHFNMHIKENHSNYFLFSNYLFSNLLVNFKIKVMVQINFDIIIIIHWKVYLIFFLRIIIQIIIINNIAFLITVNFILATIITIIHFEINNQNYLFILNYFK